MQLAIYKFGQTRSYMLLISILVFCLGLTSCASSIKPSQPVGLWYQYKAGDTLGSISRNFGVRKMDIKKANDIYDERDIEVGMRIFIPNAQKPPSSNIEEVNIEETQPRARITLVWPSPGTISSGYGLRQKRMHNGIDITKDKGKDIVAAAGGVVEFSGRKSGFGNLIIINHGNRIKTYYAHNAKLYVKKRSKIRQGQLIAKMGATGRVKGPHLHFEIRINGQSQNPLRYLPIR